MRVRLNKNFQNKFFYLLKGKNTWSRIATELGTSVCALKGYAIYGNTIPKILYNKIRTKESDEHIIRVLKYNWGKVKGGKKSRGSTKKNQKTKFSEQLAETVGIMLFLTRKDDIRTFVDKIGFNNPKNRKRFESLAP